MLPEFVKATSTKENSLLIIFVSLFWKITLLINLKELCLLLSILLLFETLISVTYLSVGGSGESAIIMPLQENLSIV